MHTMTENTEKVTHLRVPAVTGIPIHLEDDLPYKLIVGNDRLLAHSKCP